MTTTEPDLPMPPPADPSSGAPSHAGPTRRPGRRLAIVVAVLGVGLLWAMAVGWLLNDARSSLESGRAELEGVRAEATPSSLLEPATTTELEQAQANFAHARSRLRSPMITPLRLVPVVGRHIRAADHLVSSAQGSAALATTAVHQLRQLADSRSRRVRSASPP